MKERSQISHAGTLGARGIRAQHRLDEVVIGVRLVDEAPAVLVHRDQAGLGAVEQDVRIDDVVVQRARKIERRAHVLVVHRGARGARGREAVAARAREGVGMRDRRVRA